MLANAKKKRRRTKATLTFLRTVHDLSEGRDNTVNERLQIHIVKSGDRLCKITNDYLGPVRCYPKVILLNGFTSIIIYAGQELKLPVSAHLKLNDKVNTTASRFSPPERPSRLVQGADAYPSHRWKGQSPAWLARRHCFLGACGWREKNISTKLTLRFGLHRSLDCRAFYLTSSWCYYRIYTVRTKCTEGDVSEYTD